MPNQLFEEFFTAEARMFLLATIRVALSEDGPDLTSDALFTDADRAQAQIIAKQDTIVCGTPIIPLVLGFGDKEFSYHLNVEDGERVSNGTLIAALEGPVAHLLKAERVILNFIIHMSGIAELTNRYVRELEGTRTTLIDTRKTLPGLRYVDKYAVRCGGARNHRRNLTEMLMLKDNHVDRAGSITRAVEMCRQAYGDTCPPIEVECRDEDEIREAVSCGVHRVMFDNMQPDAISRGLKLVPGNIETELSGNVSLENIRSLAELGPDFISVGRLTHSASASDFSMQIIT